MTPAHVSLLLAIKLLLRSVKCGRVHARSDGRNESRHRTHQGCHPARRCGSSGRRARPRPRARARNARRASRHARGRANAAEHAAHMLMAAQVAVPCNYLRPELSCAALNLWTTLMIEKSENESRRNAFETRRDEITTTVTVLGTDLQHDQYCAGD